MTAIFGIHVLFISDLSLFHVDTNVCDAQIVGCIKRVVCVEQPSIDDAFFWLLITMMSKQMIGGVN